MFSRAKQAEIIRASQKDEYFLNTIKNTVTDLVQSTLGPRFCLKWNREYEMFSNAIYYGLTTLAGFQSLGEEYVNIVMVDGSLKALPTGVARAFMILLQCAVPYILDRGLYLIEKHLNNNTLRITSEAKEKLMNIIPALRHAILIVQRCNLALFYVKGIFYHLSKRFTNIHYILVRPDANYYRASNYKILGWLCAIQLVFSFLQQGLVMYRKTRVQTMQTTDESNVKSDFVVKTSDLSSNGSFILAKCALCLEPRKQATATPCGHVFCWACIHEWCQTKHVCPLCREEFLPSRLVFLQNYDAA